MDAHQAALRTLALKMVSDNFSDCDYQIGELIISDVVVVWVSKAIGYPPVFHRINKYQVDRPSFSKEAGNQKKGHHIIYKWSKRYWEYFDQTKQDMAMRFNDPIITLENPVAIPTIALRRQRILDLLETLTVDEVIEVVAVLVIEWARRLNINDFVRYVRNIGNASHLKALEDDSRMIVTALYYLDISFQLA